MLCLTMESAIVEIITRGSWYHTFSIGDLETNGVYDLRDVVGNIPWPSMHNKTVLDAGCSDGFFSLFFAETLGAKKVLGLDSNSYNGKVAVDVLSRTLRDYEKKYNRLNDFTFLGEYYKSLNLSDCNKFKFIKQIFSCESLEFIPGSIYDLTKSKLSADIVFCGSLLEHLRDPISAIESLHQATKDICIIDVSSVIRQPFSFAPFPLMTYTGGGGAFYNFNFSAVKAIMQSVGFHSVNKLASYKVRNSRNQREHRNILIIGKK
jgi:2-polyprenyl-3-methyl-5-hydroxy-6-metoxy-1,4-benzoquinol methylase